MKILKTSPNPVLNLKSLEEKNKKEIDTIKHDYDRLIKEMQYNSGRNFMV